MDGNNSAPNQAGAIPRDERPAGGNPGSLQPRPRQERSNVTNPYGSWDSVLGWRQACPESSLASDLVTETTSYGWIRSKTLDVFVTLVMYAQIRMAVLGINQVGSATAYLITELLAFCIPASRRLPQADADNRIIADVKSYIPLSNHRYTNEMLVNALAKIPAAERGNISAESNFDAGSVDEKNNLIKTVEDAWVIIRMLASINLAAEKQSLTTTIFCIYLSAVAKMGNVTDAYMTKIQDRVRADINISLHGTFWIPEVVEATWNAIKSFVNQNNVPLAIERFVGSLTNNGVIPENAFHLRLVAQQIRGEGLTTASTIKKAMTLFPRFNWAAVFALLPVDYTNFTIAVNEIGTNAYYGYVQDTSRIRATGYLSLGWVAKELLVKVNGDVSLRNAKCFTRSPKFKTQLEELIADFIANPPAVDPVPQSSVDDLTARLNTATGILIN